MKFDKKLDHTSVPTCKCFLNCINNFVLAKHFVRKRRQMSAYWASNCQNYMHQHHFMWAELIFFEHLNFGSISRLFYPFVWRNGIAINLIPQTSPHRRFEWSIICVRNSFGPVKNDLNVIKFLRHHWELVSPLFFSTQLFRDRHRYSCAVCVYCIMSNKGIYYINRFSVRSISLFVFIDAGSGTYN